MNSTDEAWRNLPNYLSQHVLLSFSALALGLTISLPLAILAVRFRWVRVSALGIASVIQTIPSLALLALFFPLLLIISDFTLATFGIGFRALGFLPALLALALYSMLPVLRNTVTALTAIDPAIKMAARGVGMTPWQSMRIVELPLAMPVIMAGIRTAAVWTIGTATLATPVGQTSLGNYIFTGLQTENWVFVLFGCISAALLALVVDRLLALAEDGFALNSRSRLLGALIGTGLLLSASLYPLVGSATKSVVVGAKNFDEQYILSNLISHQLNLRAISNTRREGLGSGVIFRALASNDVDVYIDYSGTIWSNEMHRSDVPDRTLMLTQMGDWLKRTYGIRYVGALGFENAYTFAMVRAKADALHINTLADLAIYAGRLKIGGDFEIFARPEWQAVVKDYGLKFGQRRQYQANLMYGALTSGEVDVISAFSSDGRIAQYDLKVLGDPKGALPPYDAVLLVSPAHARDGALLDALKPLIGAVDLKSMQIANLMVDRSKDKLSPAQAADWLAHQIRSRAVTRATR